MTPGVSGSPEDKAGKSNRLRIADLDRELNGYRTIPRDEPDAAVTVGRRTADFLAAAPPTNLSPRSDLHMQSCRTKSCIVTRPRTSRRPMPSSLAE